MKLYFKNTGAINFLLLFFSLFGVWKWEHGPRAQEANIVRIKMMDQTGRIPFISSTTTGKTHLDDMNTGPTDRCDCNKLSDMQRWWTDSLILTVGLSTRWGFQPP